MFCLEREITSKHSLESVTPNAATKMGASHGSSES